MEGPDDLFVLERGADHQHGVWDDRDDHAELDGYVKELGIIILLMINIPLKISYHIIDDTNF